MSGRCPTVCRSGEISFSTTTFRARNCRCRSCPTRRLRRCDEIRKAALTYVGLSLDKLRDYNSRMTRWHSIREVVVNTFDRHDFAFKWTYAEMAPLIEGPRVFQTIARMSSAAQSGQSARRMCAAAQPALAARDSCPSGTRATTSGAWTSWPINSPTADASAR